MLRLGLEQQRQHKVAHLVEDVGADAGQVDALRERGEHLEERFGVAVRCGLRGRRHQVAEHGEELLERQRGDRHRLAEPARRAALYRADVHRHHQRLAEAEARRERGDQLGARRRRKAERLVAAELLSVAHVTASRRCRQRRCPLRVGEDAEAILERGGAVAGRVALAGDGHRVHLRHDGGRHGAGAARRRLQHLDGVLGPAGLHGQLVQAAEAERVAGGAG
mmetsp:Transcript_5460/g.13746  ORF Transcript_5460/g.13746 Transcript_5460/m.13746 type:complete len:222 (+) Transcript_5460:1188-1853(+)